MKIVNTKFIIANKTDPPTKFGGRIPDYEWGYDGGIVNSIDDVGFWDSEFKAEENIDKIFGYDKTDFGVMKVNITYSFEDDNT